MFKYDIINVEKLGGKPMYEDLNQRDLEILFFIKRFIESKSYPPTVREICAGCNIKSLQLFTMPLKN